MTDQIQDPDREAFEAWANSPRALVSRPDHDTMRPGRYRFGDVEAAWQIWQTTRASQKPIGWATSWGLGVEFTAQASRRDEWVRAGRTVEAVFNHPAPDAAAIRAQVLKEAEKACAAKHLKDLRVNTHDIVYDGAICHCVDAIRALAAKGTM